MFPALIGALFVGASPAAGQQAPDFSGTDTDGNAFTLSDLVTRGPVIVAFFPRAFTPG